REDAESRIARVFAALDAPLSLPARTERVARSVSANGTPDEYRVRVGKARELIAAGDCIQIVLAQRFDVRPAPEPLALYRALRRVDRFSHWMHLTSVVDGELAPGVDALDAFRACFPAGTVSGAPKIRAMERIAELETDRRGPYAGAVGYLGFDGRMDTCIGIRTAVIADGVCRIQAGAGIVADSDPAAEERETRAKARGLLRAI